MAIVKRGFKWLGIASSLSFLIGSVMFLPYFAEFSVAGVWLFITGSLLMLISILAELKGSA